MAPGESPVANWRHAPSHGRLPLLVDDQWINGGEKCQLARFWFFLSQ